MDVIEFINRIAIIPGGLARRFERFVSLCEHEIAFDAHHQTGQFKPQGLRVLNIELIIEARWFIRKFQPLTGQRVMFRRRLVAGGDHQFGEKIVRQAALATGIRRIGCFDALGLLPSSSIVVGKSNRQLDCSHTPFRGFPLAVRCQA